jgi:hypothetical protein
LIVPGFVTGQIDMFADRDVGERLKIVRRLKQPLIEAELKSS